MSFKNKIILSVIKAKFDSYIPQIKSQINATPQILDQVSSILNQPNINFSDIQNVASSLGFGSVVDQYQNEINDFLSDEDSKQELIDFLKTKITQLQNR